MKKAIIIPDSFKGTLSSPEICRIIKDKITAFFPDCEVTTIPIADGGEGSVDCFLSALGGEKVSVKVKGPFFEDIDSFYGILPDKTAVIEMSAAAGLPLVEGKANPLLTTTYGAGQLILDAAEKGCKKIIVGLGGSSTNDAGVGAAAAVGIKFFDKSGTEFIPTGGTLKDICSIDISHKCDCLRDVEIITMCDIENPLYGINGAAYVFAPQKGADKNAVEKLDEGLRNFADVVMNCIKIDVSSLSGAGAAGGMGAGMFAFFGSALKSGIETVLDIVEFDNMLGGTDIVFTGEGKLDTQSLGGKAIIGVSRRAKKKNVPVIALVGGSDYDIGDVYNEGISSVFTINRLPEDFSVSRFKSEQNLSVTAENIIRMIKTIEENSDK